MMKLVRAIGLGALVAGCLPTLAAIGLVFAFAMPGAADLVGTVLFSSVPMLVSLAVVAGATLVIGVPASLLLRRLGRESTEAYAVIGGTTGAGIALMVVLLGLLDAGTFPFLLFGSIAGGITTALNWWKHARVLPACLGTA